MAQLKEGNYYQVQGENQVYTFSPEGYLKTTTPPPKVTPSLISQGIVEKYSQPPAQKTEENIPTATDLSAAISGEQPELFREESGYKVYKKEGTQIEWLNMPAEQFTATYGPQAWEQIKIIPDIDAFANQLQEEGIRGLQNSVQELTQNALTQYTETPEYKQKLAAAESAIDQEIKFMEEAPTKFWEKFWQKPENQKKKEEYQVWKKELAELDAQYETSKLYQMKRTVPGYIMIGESKILHQQYIADRATMLAKGAIIQDDYDRVIDFGNQAFEAYLNTLDKRLEFEYTKLDRVYGLPEQRRQEVSFQLDVVREQLNSLREEQDTRVANWQKNLSLYPEYTGKPWMSIEEQEELMKPFYKEERIFTKQERAADIARKLQLAGEGKTGTTPEETIDVAKEFMDDKNAGMPYEDAINLYAADLGEEWIKKQYEGGTTPLSEMPTSLEKPKKESFFKKLFKPKGFGLILGK